MQALKRYIVAHFPDQNSIITVYAVCVVFVYSWTLVVSFWKIPSWLYYLGLGDILSIYAYSMSVNFIESAILLGTVLGLSMFLPFSRRDFLNWSHPKADVSLFPISVVKVLCSPTNC